MAIKGQKFKTYPESLKREAIRLHVEERWSHREVAVHLGINDRNRVKLWLEMEVDVLKKWLEILNKGSWLALWVAEQVNIPYHVSIRHAAFRIELVIGGSEEQL